jgi:hypothetical protein
MQQQQLYTAPKGAPLTDALFLFIRPPSRHKHSQNMSCTQQHGLQTAPGNAPLTDALNSSNDNPLKSGA